LAPTSSCSDLLPRPFRFQPAAGARQSANPYPLLGRFGVRAEDLREFDGVGDAKAALEFARCRIKPEGARIETPADLLPHVRHYADRSRSTSFFLRSGYFSFLEAGRL
jgi:hypothetical protein